MTEAVRLVSILNDVTQHVGQAARAWPPGPARLSRVGAGTSPPVRHRVVDSPLGPITLVVAADGQLTGCYLEGQTHLPPPAALGDADPSVAPEAVRQLAEYFAGTRRDFELLLAPTGTDFQQRCGGRSPRSLRPGRMRMVTARRINCGSARAVGAATGLNPISIIVPCHRLVGAGGELIGYAGGLGRKRWLLDLEAAQGSTRA